MSKTYKSSFVLADGIKTHFVEAGEGEPVVLVHGGGPGASGEHNWGRNIGALAEHFRVYAIDLIGYGLTDKPPVEYSYQTKVRHLQSFIKTMCLENVRLAGNSMGAYVAVKWALEHPDNVAKVFMVATATVASALGVGGVSRQGGAVRSRVGEEVTEQSMRDWLGMLNNNKANITDELVKARVYQAKLPGAWEAQQSYRAHLKKLAEDPGLHQWYDLSGRLSRFEKPLALAWGKDDEFAPVELAFNIQKALPNLTEFHLIEGSGHHVQNDQYEFFNNVATKFFLDA